MRRQGIPMWLLRDFPAFLGVMISFWPLMILVITNGFNAMRGKQVPKSAYDDFPILLAHAEARLDFALWREAYRRLGWDPRLVTFAISPPPMTGTTPHNASSPTSARTAISKPAPAPMSKTCANATTSPNAM